MSFSTRNQLQQWTKSSEIEETNPYELSHPLDERLATAEDAGAPFDTVSLDSALVHSQGGCDGGERRLDMAADECFGENEDEDDLVVTTELTRPRLNSWDAVVEEWKAQERLAEAESESKITKLPEVEIPALPPRAHI